MGTESRLDEVYERAPRLKIGRSAKIVCMSDCHRGVGNRGDNFLLNRNLFLRPWSTITTDALPMLSWETGMSCGRI